MQGPSLGRLEVSSLRVGDGEESDLLDVFGNTQYSGGLIGIAKVQCGQR